MKTKPLHIVSMCVSVMMLSAMVILFARAVYRLDASWDTFAYHVPFAALYGRMNVPFQMGESL